MKRPYDPERVLTDERGERVPSRTGAVEWARDAITAGTTPVVATAMAIALRIDDTLVCWPRVRTLAADIRGGEKTVRRAAAALVEQDVIRVLWLWRGNEPSGCLWVLNVDGWLDDLDNVGAILARVAAVRARAIDMGLNARALPAGVELSARKPSNGRDLLARWCRTVFGALR